MNQVRFTMWTKKAAQNRSVMLDSHENICVWIFLSFSESWSAPSIRHLCACVLVCMCVCVGVCYAMTNDSIWILCFAIKLNVADWKIVSKQASKQPIPVGTRWLFCANLCICLWKFIMFYGGTWCYLILALGCSSC